MATLFVVALVTARPSSGFCMQPVPTVRCEFLNSDAVFAGRVDSVRYGSPPYPGPDDGYMYSLTVQQVFRGQLRATIQVFTPNATARFLLDVGKPYLLFAREFKGVLVIGGCGHSALFSEAQQTVRELRALKVPDDAEVEGRVSSDDLSYTGRRFAGLRVIVRHGEESYTATVNEQGWFRLHIPPGEYSAEIAANPHWEITPDKESVDKPAGFVARKGHCSGLQFLASPK